MFEMVSNYRRDITVEITGYVYDPYQTTFSLPSCSTRSTLLRSACLAPMLPRSPQSSSPPLSWAFPAWTWYGYDGLQNTFILDFAGCHPH